MERFGIFSPVYVRKDMPSTLLMESLLPDARNIRIEDGVVVRQQGRELEMFGTYGTTQFNVPVPASVHAITSITSGTKTICINGNHASSFTAGQIVTVSDSATQASDGHYTVVTSTWNTPNTDIVVTEAITTGGAAGNLTWGAATILKYYTQVGGVTGDTEYLFAFTANHAWLWDSVKRIWKLRHTTASAVNWWSATSFNDQMLLCNWGSTGVVDKIMVWDPSTPGTLFAALGSSSGLSIDSSNYIVGAKHITSFENHVWLGYVQIGSTPYPRANYWSDIGDATAWKTGDAGGWNGELNPTTAVLPGSDFQSGFGEIEGSLIIFKEGSIHQIWLVATDEIWNAQKISHVIGCKAPDSIVRDAAGKLYFLATDSSIREIRGGIVSDPLDPVIRQLEPSVIGGVRSAYIGALKKIWWAVPAMIGGLTPTTNTALLQLSLKDMSWQICDIPVSAFGAYMRQTAYTWDNQPDGTWDDWGGTWDESDGSAGYVIDLVADYNGYTWAAHAADGDAGGSFEGYFELGTDLSEGNATAMYKRLLELRFILESIGTSGTATISISVDRGNYTTIGTIDLSGTGTLLEDIYPDIRGRHFRIKFTAAHPFKFLGCVFGYEWDGEY